MILMLWPQANARAIVIPQAPAFRLFLRYLQPFPPPQTFNPLMVHSMPAFQPKQSRDPPVAIPAILLCQLDNALQQDSFIILNATTIPLR